jgi:hypothetical protein
LNAIKIRRFLDKTRNCEYTFLLAESLFRSALAGPGDEKPWLFEM